MGGYNMILYLAALQNVDPELYEPRRWMARTMAEVPACDLPS